uniref:Uncharacterized protein n=1 Tax=Anguilla anguilla TaxID=7936 RepID=A0A0E9W1G1_ANGAN
MFISQLSGVILCIRRNILLL